MQERQTIFETERRHRPKCRLCGAYIRSGEPFDTDGQEAVHVDCFFEFQEREVTANECTV